MDQRIKILIVAGTRPEVIKLAPIVLAATELHRNDIDLELCLTGQHQTLADEAMSIFGIKEDYNLRIMSPNQTLNGISRSMFEFFPAILEKVEPNVVIVQGDTTTASIAALCAFNMRIPVGHVEAGLRSFDLSAPYPEELNRKVITCVAQFNFCPTGPARANLLRESVPQEMIFVTGNTIVDALRTITKRHKLEDVRSIAESIHRPFVLVTAHRRESFGSGIRNICEAIRQCSEQLPWLQFVYPVHPNPNIDGPVRATLGNIGNIVLLPPVSYLSLLTLLKNCELVVSDSGGIQEEAPSFEKFCVVLRNVTERMESVDLGLSELVGTETGNIVKAVAGRLTGQHTYPGVSNPYGDGRASERILEVLVQRGVNH